ncbi:hypothetical protein GIB67_016496 [Kingdonia uniflora]|uniref:RING-type E3 ubiquitin transferase n=1 Tax=Kingdonia uniflora TaxID=39325 RepID=A0A7J7M8D9_9MAGN|nr:hypothetical protein GIB67_016496 [Kingdonia uniflora]
MDHVFGNQALIRIFQGALVAPFFSSAHFDINSTLSTSTLLPEAPMKSMGYSSRPILYFIVYICLLLLFPSVNCEDDHSSHATRYAGLLFMMFVFIFVFIIFYKICNRRSHLITNDDIRQLPVTQPRGVAEGRIATVAALQHEQAVEGRVGLDPSLIETFPTFLYSVVKLLNIGKEVLECTVCLNHFKDGEIVRLLPKCYHGFHRDCIDAWLESHNTCPVCRDKPVPVPVLVPEPV